MRVEISAEICALAADMNVPRSMQPHRPVTGNKAKGGRLLQPDASHHRKLTAVIASRRRSMDCFVASLLAIDVPTVASIGAATSGRGYNARRRSGRGEIADFERVEKPR